MSLTAFDDVDSAILQAGQVVLKLKLKVDTPLKIVVLCRYPVSGAGFASALMTRGPAAEQTITMCFPLPKLSAFVVTLA